MGALNSVQGCARDALAPPPPWKSCTVFHAVLFTVKRSIDQLFMHYFHNFSSASGDFAGPQTPSRAPPLDPAVDFRFQTT